MNLWKLRVTFGVTSSFLLPRDRAQVFSLVCRAFTTVPMLYFQLCREADWQHSADPTQQCLPVPRVWQGVVVPCVRPVLPYHALCGSTGSLFSSSSPCLLFEFLSYKLEVLLYRPRWPQTPRDPAASEFQVLGLTVCTTIPSGIHHFNL